jgi:murein DD-endopeptidase MepM/ murein hydrolase activator NlpD
VIDRTAVVTRLRPAEWDWDWGSATDGALALDPSESWLEPPPERKKVGTVPRMPAPSRQAAAARGRRKHAVTPQHRTRRLVVLTVVAGALLGTLFVTAFGQGATRQTSQALPGPSSRLLPVGPPTPLTVALHSGLRIQLPIAQTRVTAIGYHSSDDGVLPLTPLGRQGNEGALSRLAHKIFGGGHGGFVYYQLSGGETALLDVGAVSGTDVYAPVDGTIVGISDYVLNGKTYGSRIDIQPSAAPSLVVSLTHLSPDPALTVGAAVAASTTKVGRVVDLSGVERQALAKYTHDAGNHVSIELRPAATLTLP